MRSQGITFRIKRGAFCMLLMVAAALLALAGCDREASRPSDTGATSGTPQTNGAAPTASGAKKKIVFVFKIGGISYSEACKAGAEQANNDPSLNATVEYQASTEGTAEKQADIINQAIVGKADAIVISPVDAKAIIPAMEKAAEAGIKVFAWDNDVPGSNREFYVTAVDDVQIGADIMDALAKSIGEKGKVLIYSGQRNAESLNLHIRGVEEAAKKYPGITLVQPYIYNEEDKTKSTSIAAQALQAHPDLAGVAGVNSLAPPGAGEAIRKLNLIGKVKVWGLALPSETKPYLLDGSVTGLYLWDPKKLTYLTARLVRDALDGKMPQDGQEIPGEGKLKVKDGVVTLPLRLEITSDNVEQMKF